MATERVNVMKELHRLLRKADRLYDGQVEFVMDDGEKMDVNEEQEQEEVEKDEHLLKFFFFVTPKEGPYRRAKIKFHVSVDLYGYPQNAPEVTCRNKIYHPNINVKDDYESGADICVNLLGDDWEPDVGLDGAVMAVLFLFYHPEIDDALSPVCTDFKDYEEYEEKVRRSLRGETVDGNEFDLLLFDYTDTEDEEGAVTVTTEEKENGFKGVGEKAHCGAGAIPMENVAEMLEEATITNEIHEDTKETTNSIEEGSAVNDTTKDALNTAVEVEQVTLVETKKEGVIVTTNNCEMNSVDFTEDPTTKIISDTETVAEIESQEKGDFTNDKLLVAVYAGSSVDSNDVTKSPLTTSGMTAEATTESEALVTEPAQMTICKQNLTKHPHNDHVKYSPFKAWYSKLKDLFSNHFEAVRKR